GLGVLGLEQTVGYSTDDEILISREAPGAVFSQLRAESVAAMSEGRFINLIDTISTMVLRGIVPNPEQTSDYTHDIKAGFTLLDYRIVDNPETPTEPHDTPELFKTLLTNIVTEVSGPHGLQRAW